MRLRFLTRLRGVRPTRDGVWVMAAGGCLLVVALNSGNNLLYLLLSMMIALLVTALCIAEASLRGIVPKRSPPARLHAGVPFLMGIALRNEKKRLSSFSIEVEDLCDEKVVDKRCYFLKIPSGRTQQTAYRHTLPRRGRYVFSAFRISTKFPFALFRSSRYVEHRSEIVVYPAIVPLQHFPKTLTSAVGERSMPKLGRRGNFHGLREYQTGDDPRDIHWRSSARRQRLMVREQEIEAVQQVTLFVDNALPLDKRDDPDELDNLEKVISWAASLGAFYLEQGYAVRLCVRSLDPPLSPLWSPSSLQKLLLTLALLPTVSPDVPFQKPPPLPRHGTLPVAGSGDSLILVRPGADLSKDKPCGHILEAK
ncbi:MAG TPA: DUF58 domain-containing protein [Pseudomonadota bacterium]|nr:DUF58 domain-containing protein [Pseudomonadota bacterium]